jgi:cardiolipin synthase (CMP-forming)
VIDTRLWGQVLLAIATILTVWSMLYYFRLALAELKTSA